MPLHPFIVALIEKQKAAGWPGLSAGSPQDGRALIAASRAALGAGPEMEVRALALPTRAGAIPARLYLPSGRLASLVVYVHGGGWALGALDDFDVLARTLAARSNSAVLLPDYRLAPEHPFPAGLEDVEDVLLMLASDAAPLPPQARSLPLVAAGDSAGANLVTVACRTLLGRVAPALQVLIYPVADCDMDNASYRAHGEGLPLTKKDMAWFYSLYAPAELHAHPNVSPLRAPSLEGLAPAFVLVAGYDVLRDEGLAYAERLRAAAVPVQQRLYEDVTHGFLRLHNLFDVADEAVGDIAAAIREAVEEPPARA